MVKLKGMTMSSNTSSSHEPSPASTQRTSALGARRGYLIKLTAISTLGGLLFGYDTGVISGALPFMKEDLGLSEVQEATVVSSLLFGAMLGSLIGGKLADAIGRKRSMLTCAVLFLFGALGTALAPSFAVMVPARIVLGIAVGAAAATVPLYLAEMAPVHGRGRMVTINELMIVGGQFLAFAINAIIASVSSETHVWRWMLSVAVIPAIALLIGMFFLPDSPRWYALRGRLGDTRRVLDQSRSPEEAAEEYNVIVEHAKRDKEEAKGAAVRALRVNKWMRRILWIGVGIGVASQATGINTVNYYAPTILASAGVGTSAALVLTVAVGVVGVIGTIVGIILLGHVNRRRLVTIGYTGVAAGHLLLALMFLLPESPLRAYLILAAMLVVVAFVQTFVGTLTWLLLSEIFPMAIRGFAMGAAVFLLWTVNTIISFVFPLLVGALGSTFTFGLFAIVNACSLAFMIKFCPETRGRSLEELEDDFRSHDPAHLVHQAPADTHGS